MAVWAELKLVLARLRDQQPGTLMQYPMPEVDEDRQPPFTIHLAPWAVTAGEVVGGFSGAQHLPLIIFRVAPEQNGRVPLLIGTASFTARLGYAVPAGDWGVQATLTLGPDLRDSPRRRTPVLPLTITA